MSNYPFDILGGRSSGYWGGNPHARVSSELIAEKVLGMNYQKVMAMGMPFALWREASTVQDDLTTCSCVKDTAKQPDIPCLSCYGTGTIPGYLKFGTRTYWAAAVDEGWGLSNITLDKQNRPFRFQLSAAATSGTATSPNIPISIIDQLGDWESKSDGFTRDGGAASTITVQASKDGGLSWFALSALTAQAPTTQIRFKVTITRTSVSVKSPMFEIVRVRFPTFFDIRGEYTEPVIRAIPTWLTEAEIRQTHGLKLEASGNKMWTLPLTLFDHTIAIESMGARIKDDVFVEERFGAETGYRYAVTEFSYSDTFAKFTRQEMTLRKLSGTPGEINGEAIYRVF